MKTFKTEKEVREFFKGVTFKFDFICDGVADFKTTIPIEVNEGYADFTVSVFPEENPFGVYDSFDSLLDGMQIFKVTINLSESNESKELFYKKFTNYRNN